MRGSRGRESAASNYADDLNSVSMRSPGNHEQQGLQCSSDRLALQAEQAYLAVLSFHKAPSSKLYHPPPSSAILSLPHLQHRGRVLSTMHGDNLACLCAGCCVLPCDRYQQSWATIASRAGQPLSAELGDRQQQS
jgi:hypothetical protein